MDQASTLNPSQENVDVNTLSAMMQKAATFLVDQSKQAAEYTRQIEELRQEIGTVKDRVTSALAENQRLRDELYRTVTERDQAKREAEDNKNLAQSYSHDLDETRGRLDETSKSLADTRTRLGQVENDHREAIQDRDYWRGRANRAEKAQAEAEAKLAKMQASFKAIMEGALQDEQPKPGQEQPQTQPTQAIDDDWTTQHHKTPKADF